VEVAPAVTYVADFEADLLAVYPGLARRLTLVAARAPSPRSSRVAAGEPSRCASRP
jgi:hypothetical protein